MSLTNIIERYSGDDSSGFSRKNLAFAFLILLTRIPFIFTGFGTDEDSWGVALTALHIHDTFLYEVSRFPGFPVHEIISAVFISGGAVALNLMTAIMSSLAVLFFVCALQQMHFRLPYLAGIAFAFTPAVFIHSTDTIDYMWAMTFMMWSFYLILQNKLLPSAIILALATGCRITSLSMLMPFCVLLIDKNLSTKKNVAVMARYSFIAIVCSVIIYLPVFFKYGNAFFTFYDLSGYPTIPKVLYKFSIGVWGIFGCAAIMYGIGVLLFTSLLKSKRFLLPKTTNEKHVIAWLVAIDLTIIIFVRLPYESGYLIPMIPFTILVFGKYLYDRAFIIFSLLICVSPWLVSISTQSKSDSPQPAKISAQFKIFSQDLNIDLLRGALCTDAVGRKATVSFADSVIEESKFITDTSVVLCGWWSTKVIYQYAMLPVEEKNDFIIWEQYLNKDQLINYVQKRYNIFYLPLQDSFEKKLYGIDIKYFGAVPLFETEEEETTEELKPES
jgi:hypothetical protein